MKGLFGIVLAFVFLIGGCTSKVEVDNIPNLEKGRFQWVGKQEIDGALLFVLRDSTDGKCHLILSGSPVSDNEGLLKHPVPIPNVPCGDEKKSAYDE